MPRWNSADQIDDWFARCRLAWPSTRRAADAMNGTADDFRCPRHAQPGDAGHDVWRPADRLCRRRPAATAGHLAPTRPGPARWRTGGRRRGAAARRARSDAAEWECTGAPVLPLYSRPSRRPPLNRRRAQPTPPGSRPSSAKAWRRGWNRLIAQDEALAEQAAAIDAVDRLVHACAISAGALINFVAFRDFYASGNRAVFQAGIATSTAAKLQTYVMRYCSGERRPPPRCTLSAPPRLLRLRARQQTSIAAAPSPPATPTSCWPAAAASSTISGRARDWDATITRIVEPPYPSSVNRSPLVAYKKVVRLAIEQFRSRRRRRPATTCSPPTRRHGGKP